MSWLHSQQSNFVFTVPILMEGTVYTVQEANKLNKIRYKLTTNTTGEGKWHKSPRQIVYIYRGICHTRPCMKTLRSANPWMNVPKWSKLQQISPAQGVGSNGPCVGSMSIGSCMDRTSNKLIIWIRCVNKERHAKYAERGGRGLELRTSDLK